MCSCHIYLYIDTFVLITKHLSMIKVLQKVIFILSDAESIRGKLANLNFSSLCFKYELENYYFCLFKWAAFMFIEIFILLWKSNLTNLCTYYLYIRKQLIDIRVVWFSVINCDECLIIEFNDIEMSDICTFCISFI